jgi:hypothetical protein
MHGILAAVCLCVQVSGKITVSWFKGSKKIQWAGEPIKLPGLQVCACAFRHGHPCQPPWHSEDHPCPAGPPSLIINPVTPTQTRAQAPSSTSATISEWVRFFGGADAPVTVEAGLEISLAAGPPACWAAALVDVSAGSQASVLPGSHVRNGAAWLFYIE